MGNLESAIPNRKSWGKAAWRIARPLILVYLVIVLGMMFLETWLVYPIPRLEWGDWHPTGFHYEDVQFASADGTKLHGWFVPHPNSRWAILYCHGNGEDVAAVGPLAAQLSNALHASVFAFDYRGYGHSEGRPSEVGCIADGQAARQWLAKRTGRSPREVVLMGRSLGSAVAVALAADEGAAAIVLECAFPSMVDVAALHYPWLPVRWIMKNRYDNLARIKEYDGPLLQSHGCSDQLIPIASARQLFGASPSKAKRWIEFPGLGHNNIWPEDYNQTLSDFLDAATPSSALGTAEKDGK
jgi:uncharacterized protein